MSTSSTSSTPSIQPVDVSGLIADLEDDGKSYKDNYYSLGSNLPYPDSNGQFGETEMFYSVIETTPLIAEIFSKKDLELLQVVDYAHRGTKSKKLYDIMREEDESKGKLNETNYLHFSPGIFNHFTRDSILLDGLDNAFSKTGFLGKGIYFSKDITKCDSYYNGDKKGIRSVLVCKVLSGKKLTLPPGTCFGNFKTMTKPSLKHDSTEGSPKGKHEICIYDKNRCLIVGSFTYRSL